MSLFSRNRRDIDLDDEIRVHLDMAIAERVARGETRSDAERAARREFGNVAHVKEVTRAAWGGQWLERLRQDLRFGVRSLLRVPGFTATAVLTIALGIGATTSMFTVVNGVLLRPLPFRDPERLVALSHGPPGTGTQAASMLADVQFLALRGRSSPFTAITTYGNQPATLTGVGDPLAVSAAVVTTEFFDVLGVAPALGPGFDSRTNGALNPRVVILGDGLWRSRFAADARVVGAKLTIDGVPRTIVGVMPPGFLFPNRAEIWIPLEVRATPGNSLSRPVIARLRDDVTMDQSRAGFATIASTFESVGDDSTARGTVVPLKTLVVGDVRRPLLIFSGAVGLVLLIACTNVTNLLLMRAGTRDREMAVRAALGAGRGRLVRQLLTESALLAVIGGVAGGLLAIGGVRVFLAVVPPGTLPRMSDITVNGAVLAFTIAVVVATGLAFGLTPAVQATRRDLRESLGEGGRTYSARPGRLRNVLVVAQIGLALVLLTGAGLLVRSFQRIRAIDLGFHPEQAVTFNVQLSAARYGTAQAMQELHARAVDGLARIPGVVAAGAVNWLPLGMMHLVGDITIEGLDAPVPRYQPYKLGVTPGYFRSMGIALRRGRDFTAHDDASAPGVVIISQSVAEQFWPGGNALGQRLSLRDRPTAADWREIVGIVDDAVQAKVAAGSQPAVYQPLSQITQRSFLGNMNFVVRTTATAESVAPMIRLALAGVDPELPVRGVFTMDELVLSTMGERLFHARLLGAFSMLALVLAAVGVYGVVAYSVAERRHELGIRMALGAQAQDIVVMVLRRTLWLVVPGVVLGTFGALAATRVLATLLFRIAPTDPVTFGIVAAGLTGVAIVAGAVPAHRATHVDPVEVLKA